MDFLFLFLFLFCMFDTTDFFFLVFLSLGIYFSFSLLPPFFWVALLVRRSAVLLFYGFFLCG